MRALFLMAFVALAGCSSEPESNDLTDAEAIAMVEQSQRVPAGPIELQPFALEEAGAAATTGWSCVFLPDGRPDGTVLYADASGALVKVRGEIVSLAADKGSAIIFRDIYRKYDGAAFALSILPTTDRKPTAPETYSWNAQLSAINANEELALKLSGQLDCSWPG